jgi:hypothetical protein
MSSMKKTKEGINLKKLLRLKNTGSIFVIAGLLMNFCNSTVHIYPAKFLH